MAATYSHGNFGVDLCRALGIPPERVVTVTLICKAGDMVTANVDFLVDQQAAGNVITLMGKYQIEKRPD